MRKRSMLLAAGACLATLTLTVGSAVADPIGPPPFRELAGTGADGPENLMNALSEVITIGGTKVIGSYFSSGSPTISTKSTPACTNIPRPNSGGQGVNALNGIAPPAGFPVGCAQFARQVTDDRASRAGQNLTYIPYARDALAYVIRDDSPLPQNLTFANLFSIYNCEVPGIRPLLGPSGAGTRRLFLTTIGHIDSPNFTTLHPCVVDGVPENRGNQLITSGDIAPHSVAQYLSQKNDIVPDSTGRTVLASINGITPFVQNAGSAIPREIYNVVPNSLVGTEPTNTVFVGPGSRVCAETATIQRFGFGTHSNCGSQLVTPPN